MKKMTLLFLSLYFGGNLGACAFKKEPEPADVRMMSAEEGPSFDARLIPGSEPQMYQVQLNWAAPSTAVDGWVLLRDDDQGQRIRTHLSGDVLSFTDTEVVAGHSYIYEIAALHGKNGYQSQTARARVPLDFVVEGTQIVNRIGSDYGRLFFKPGSRILTQGRGLEINVTEIISQDGIIETFPENQTAESGLRGRSSGVITIQAKRAARGILRFYLRSESGGVGAPGAAGGPGARGAPGAPGESGYFPGMPDGVNYCFKAPSNGGRGDKGARGGSGGRGADGGDIDLLSVSILEESGFQMPVEVSAGRGGAGGEGGCGGVGGEGGAAGVVVEKKIFPGRQPDLIQRINLPVCKANSGSRGEDGERGSQGSNGIDGNVIPYCIRIGSNSLGTCS